MADVDSGRVLTAEFIMGPPPPLHRDKHNIHDALKLMDKEGTDALYVINAAKGVDGIVRRPRLESLVNEGKKDLATAIRGDFPKASPMARLYDLYEVSGRGEPIAIIGQSGKLEGVVHPLDIFAALAGEPETTSTEPNTSTEPDEATPVSTNGHLDPESVPSRT
jgi:glycine betaine/proline transport system ATP-binding protein